MIGSIGGLDDAIDAALEFPVIPSFSRIGAAIRRRSVGWRRLDDYRLDGRTIVITGATSGIGRAAAEQLVRCGAAIIAVGRTPEHLERLPAELAAIAPNADITTVQADLGVLDDVRTAAARITERTQRVDALLHNAGALLAQHRTTDAGTEVTVASQVYGPFLLTALLLPHLRAAAPGRVVTMASGGMYTADLTVDDLEMTPGSYRGAEQYARAKRAQVTLTEMWAERIPPDEIVFHSMHPGWVDTPGVDAALPRFARLMGPVLRTPAEGADTLVWLAADDEATRSSGRFWLDRRVRPIHRLGRTRTSDTPDRRRELWSRCVDLTGAVVDDFTAD